MFKKGQNLVNLVCERPLSMQWQSKTFLPRISKFWIEILEKEVWRRWFCNFRFYELYNKSVSSNVCFKKTVTIHSIDTVLWIETFFWNRRYRNPKSQKLNVFYQFLKNDMYFFDVFFKYKSSFVIFAYWPIWPDFPLTVLMWQ